MPVRGPGLNLAPGRYCLAVCYCGTCPHWKPFELTDAQRARLLAYLKHPPAYHNNRPNPQHQRDPLGGITS